MGAKGFLKNAMDKGKGLVQSVSDKTKTAVDHFRSDADKNRLKMLNPLFPEEYSSPDYEVPETVRLVSSRSRADEKLCEGAIGWTEYFNDMPVLQLYKESVSFSGLTFLPAPEIGSLYQRHPQHPGEYVLLDTYFEDIKKEQTSELERVFFDLGASRFTVEIIESSENDSMVSKDASASLKIKIANASSRVSQQQARGEGKEASIRTETEFDGSREPVRPSLNWFKDNKSLLEFIELRLSPVGKSIRKKSFEFRSTDVSSMSMKTAANLDVAVMKYRGKAGASFSEQVRKKSRYTLRYDVVF